MNTRIYNLGNWIKQHIFSITLILFFLLLGYVALIPHQNVAFDNESCISFNDGWTYVDNNGSTQTVSFPTTLPANIENGVRLTNTLPEDSSVEITTFSEFCVFQELKIYIEDELIFDSTDSNRSSKHFDKTDGAFWSFASLPTDYAGKKITIELTSAYPDYVGILGNIFLGTKNTIIYELLHRYVFNLIIALVFILGGIGFLILSLYLYYKKIGKKNLAYLGWFQLWIGVWVLSESALLQFFIGNGILINVLAFVSIRLLIISFFHYYDSVGQFHWRKLQHLLLLLLYIEAAITALLQICQIRDYYETLIPFHIILFICIIFFVVNVIYETIICKNELVHYFIYSIFALGTSSILELYNFYFSNRMNVGVILSIGLLFCVIIIAHNELAKAFRMIELGREASYYEKLAKLDFMTGCLNRTAFQRDLDRQSDLFHSNTPIAAIMCDVNNLKTINDTYGHQTGDSAILSCSNYLKKVFDDYGLCYRTGGDEFTCILHLETEDLLLEKIEQFLSICERENVHCEHDFSVAIGYSFYDDTIDSCIENTITRADKNMYQMKRSMKNPVNA